MEKRGMGGQELEHKNLKLELLLEKMVCFSLQWLPCSSSCAGRSPRST